MLLHNAKSCIITKYQTLPGLPTIDIYQYLLIHTYFRDDFLFRWSHSNKYGTDTCCRKLHGCGQSVSTNGFEDWKWAFLLGESVGSPGPVCSHSIIDPHSCCLSHPHNVWNQSMIKWLINIPCYLHFFLWTTTKQRNTQKSRPPKWKTTTTTTNPPPKKKKKKKENRKKKNEKGTIKKHFNIMIIYI